MKIRNGFVSNSSSSSFVIHKYYLSEEQIAKMFNYVEVVGEYLKDNPLPEKGYYDYDQPSPEYDFSYCDSSWSIKEFNDFIFGDTSMDNFSFFDFFRFIGIDDNNICWDDGYNDYPTEHQEYFLEEERKKVIKIIRKEKLDKLDNDELER